MSKDKSNSSLLFRLSEGLSKSAKSFDFNLPKIFKGSTVSHGFLEELEDILIASDFGVSFSEKIILSLSKKKFDNSNALEIKKFLANEIQLILEKRSLPLLINNNKPHVILIVGVNGVGKTTTIGKLAYKFERQGKSVLIAAGDTFRAAAIDQLKVWNDRANASLITSSMGSDSAALSYEALQRAREEKKDILIIDTAGRLQNKIDLMSQLEKIPRVLKKIDEDCPHSVLLVLDASTGQNAINQVELFNKSCGLTGLIMTKLDGSAKGGVLVSIADKFDIPFNAIGVGEGIEDLQDFDPQNYSKALLGLI